jgi:hypothetical protein
MSAPAPTRASSGPRPMSHPSVPGTCSDRNGCARFAFCPRADPLFVPLAPCAQRVRARSYTSVPTVRTRSHLSTRGPTCSHLESAPGSTRPRPFPCVCAQRICALMNGRKRPHPRPRKESTPGPMHPRPIPPIRAPFHAFVSNAITPDRTCDQ